MSHSAIATVQRKLAAAGLDPGPIDGFWGERTASALDQALRHLRPTRVLAWGAAVSSAFRARVVEVAEASALDPSHLMACIAFETGETFSPSVRNAAGSGATGLIQFMPATARDLGTSTSELSVMTAVDQLDYVELYFRRYRGRCHTLEDTYMAILLPSMIGKPDGEVLFSSGAAYRQNSGLDSNRDGKVTKYEAAAKVRAMLEKGLLPNLAWVGA